MAGHPAAEPDVVAIMFSGGRDSSLAAVTYCLRGRTVQLLRFSTGFGIPSSLPDIREAELRSRFEKQLLPSVLMPVHGLVRAISVASIEQDFRRFNGKNLVLLGEKLAIHAASLTFCLANNIGTLADGTSGYQAEMPEQRSVAITFFQDLSTRYGIRYETPIAEIDSEMDVKYALLEAGMSTKSLEGLSMFADSFTRADDQTILAYLRSKEHTACSYIERFAGREELLRNADQEETRGRSTA
jgi:predicted subunit of tRNA(5-methylaminomethyl-2-thiouridylate) methyltransferase